MAQLRFPENVHAPTWPVLATALPGSLLFAGPAYADETPAGVPGGWYWFALSVVIVVGAVAGGYIYFRKETTRTDASYSAEERKIIDATFTIGTTISIFATLGGLAMLVACLGLADGIGRFASFFGADLLVAAAAGSAGAVFGFIFGIPRTLDPASRAVVASAAAQSGSAATTGAVLAANTNLERVSDWLTTLLIGATLVQIREIPGWVKDIAAYLEQGSFSNTKIVPFAIVYFFGLAFLGVYLITRLYLTSALTQTFGLLMGNDGVSDVTVLRAMLANTRTSSDPQALCSALGVFDRWQLREDERSDPLLNAQLVRLLAKYLSTGKVDDATIRLAQLKTALGKAAADATAKAALKAELDNKSLTTGDPVRDAELRNALN